MSSFAAGGGPASTFDPANALPSNPTALRNPDAIDALGFDAVFRRMWSFYLAYSEAGFRGG